MDKDSEYVLSTLLTVSGNGECVDCRDDQVAWASVSLGVFLCQQCASIHRSLGTHISRVKSLRLDRWDEDHLQTIKEVGNARSQADYEKHVPVCYRRPGKYDPHVLKTEWIRAKYERLEFQTPAGCEQYTAPVREGMLWKRGKDDKKFHPRRFRLIETENSLTYWNKEDPHASPKAVLRLDTLNVVLVPDKDGHTRSLFVYAEDSQELVCWYTNVRSAKLNRLRIAYPGVEDEQLCENLTHDFKREGWLSKTGPRVADAFRRRWFTLDRRKLRYYEDPLDAFPKGEIFIGTKDNNYDIRQGMPASTKEQPHSFTLKTPERVFHMSADNEEELQAWLEVLRQVLETPMAPQDKGSMYKMRRGRST